MNKSKLTFIIQKSFFWPLVFFLAAFILRLVYFFQIKSDPLTNIPILDAAYYEKWAKDIIAGVPFTNSAYFVEPGYAYILAFFHKIFGAGLTPIIFFQFLLSSATVAMVYMIGDKLFSFLPEFNSGINSGITFSQKVGIAAAVLMLLLRPLIFYDGLLLKTSVEIFLITLILLFISYIDVIPGVIRNLVKKISGRDYLWLGNYKLTYFILGLLFGITAVIKANIIYTLPLVILVLFIGRIGDWKKNIFIALCIVFGTVIPVLPVTYHNWRVSRSFVPINYSGGPNIYIGNWSGSDGSMRPPEFISMSPESEETSWVKMTEAYAGKNITPAEVSSYWIKRAWQESMANKDFFWSITAKKVLLLFHSLPLDDNYSIEYALNKFVLLTVLWPFWILAVLGIMGIVIWLWKGFGNWLIRKKKSVPENGNEKKETSNFQFLFSEANFRFPINHFLFLAIFFGYALTLVAAHVAERYRLALAPILAIFGGYFLALVFEKITDLKNVSADSLYDARKYLKIVPVAIILFFLIYLANRDLGQITRTSPADTWNNLGSEALDLGKTSDAENYFKRSIDADSMMAPAHSNLGKAFLEEGKFDDSISELQRALKLQPDASASLLEIAMDAKRNNTSTDEVKNQIEDLKNKKEDELFDLDYIEAMKLLRAQKYSEALPMLEKVKDRYPDNGQILTNIGMCYKNNGDLDKAKETLALAIINDGYNLPARYNQVNVLRKRKENDLALTQLSIINSIVPGYMLSQLQLAELQAAKGNNAAAKKLYEDFLADQYNASLYPDQYAKVKAMMGKI